ncbi:MAG: alpha/beta hydrolase [Flavobacteriales bacterium]
MKKTVAAFATIAVLNSCAWNKQFLQPEPIPATARVGKSINPATGDTVLMHIAGPTHQPTFTRPNGDTLPLPYTVESVLLGSAKEPLNGWMMKPKSPSKLPLVTLLFLHGNGGNITTEYSSAVAFLERGFQVFIFDYSGYGFSQGKATRSNVLHDAEMALDYVRSRSDVAGTPIVVYGQSLGGHTAALLAGEVSSTVALVVIEGGFTSYRAIAKAVTHTGPLPYLIVKEGPRALRSLGHYTGPLLVIHSRDDEVVPFTMGQELFDAGNELKQFHAIDGCHVCGPSLLPDSITTWIRKILP